MHLFMYAFICVCIYLLPFFKEYIMRLRRKDSEICMYIYIYILYMGCFQKWNPYCYCNPPENSRVRP